MQRDLGGTLGGWSRGAVDARSDAFRRRSRAAAVGVGFVLALWIVVFYGTAFGGWLGANLGWDLTHYLAGVRDWLATGSPYSAASLMAPVRLDVDTMPFMHPPIALILFAPFTLLPAVLWWAIPLGVLGWCLWSWRPEPWTWVLVLAVLGLGSTMERMLSGNTDLWVAAAFAAGLRWGWPSALLLLKPAALPFALVGIRSRSWWVTAAVVCLVAIPFGALWLEWITVVRNTAGGAGYLLGSLPLLAVLVVAWARRPQPGSTIEGDLARVTPTRSAPAAPRG